MIDQVNRGDIGFTAVLLFLNIIDRDRTEMLRYIVMISCLGYVK